MTLCRQWCQYQHCTSFHSQVICKKKTCFRFVRECSSGKPNYFCLLVWRCILLIPISIHKMNFQLIFHIGWGIGTIWCCHIKIICGKLWNVIKFMMSYFFPWRAPVNSGPIWVFRTERWERTESMFGFLHTTCEWKEVQCWYWRHCLHIVNTYKPEWVKKINFLSKPNPRASRAPYLRHT